MRKVLIGILVCLMLIGSCFFIVNGFKAINVKGARGIDEKNTQIENKITELSSIISGKYTSALSDLKQVSNKLIDSKTEYENQAALSNSNSSSYVSKLETYDIDYLWTKLGNYAKDENVVIKIEVTSSGASANLYDLKFTVTGSYVGTTDFIYDIENDSKLGFKIDNFKMNSGVNAEVIGAFVCQDIPLSVGNIENSSEETTTTNSSANRNDNSTDKNNNSTNKTNTTNTTGANTKNNNTETNTLPASEYGISDPNHSNLTSIDQVVKERK